MYLIYFTPILILGFKHFLSSRPYIFGKIMKEKEREISKIKKEKERENVIRRVQLHCVFIIFATLFLHVHYSVANRKYDRSVVEK
jgi:uncharacterized membrane protein